MATECLISASAASRVASWSVASSSSSSSSDTSRSETRACLCHFHWRSPRTRLCCVSPNLLARPWSATREQRPNQVHCSPFAVRRPPSAVRCRRRFADGRSSSSSSNDKSSCCYISSWLAQFASCRRIVCCRVRRVGTWPAACARARS